MRGYFVIGPKIIHGLPRPDLRDSVVLLNSALQNPKEFVEEEIRKGTASQLMVNHRDEFSAERIGRVEHRIHVKDKIFIPCITREGNFIVFCPCGCMGSCQYCEFCLILAMFFGFEIKDEPIPWFHCMRLHPRLEIEHSKLPEMAVF